MSSVIDILHIIVQTRETYFNSLKVSNAGINKIVLMIVIEIRAAQLREVIPIISFTEKAAILRLKKTNATIILLVTLKVSFLLQFLQFQFKK